MPDELLRQILSEIKELKIGQEELKIGQEELKLGQEELKTAQEELKVGQLRIETKLNATYDQVVRNSEDITEIKYKLNGHAQLIGIMNKRVTSLENEKIGAEG